METGRGSVKLFCEDGMGWEGGGRPGVGELDPAATAATLSPGGVMITTPAGPGRAERAPPPFSSRRAGILRLHFIYIEPV